MKTNLSLIKRTRPRALIGATIPTLQTAESEILAGSGVRERFRRLDWNELVRQGDFVANGGRRLEPWEGPNGFRADAFVKPIFRRLERRPTAAKKRQ